MVADPSGTLYVVATPIGNLGDISRRALDVLTAVDLVAAEDTRHSGRLLSHFGLQRPMWSLHDHNEQDQTPALIRRLRAGDDLALICDAGTPLVSDPGYTLVKACREQGMKVVPVPGPSALIAALSVSGLPTDRFCFEGFLPRKAVARQERLKALSTEAATLVFYESSHRILAALTDFVQIFGADRRAVVARELTKLHETVLSATLGELQLRLEEDEVQRKGEFVLMVAGAPARSDDDVSKEAGLILKVLLDDLPLKQATTIAARLTGVPKNRLYQMALDTR